MKNLDELRPDFGFWEKTKDLIDQCIDLMLNFRQSGHPGGSRSKVHGLVTTLLSGAMRWDIREPGKRFGDRFVHRTGHSLGEEVHGNGVHLDDFETHDDRRLLPGTGMTIEPGVYFEDFGLRTEINMHVGCGTATVTGPQQTEIRTLR